MELLKLENVSVKYKTREGRVLAAEDVNISMKEQETLGIVGESGCGKSTLGNAVLGILPKETTVDGKILFNGTDLLSLPRKKFRMIRGKDLSMIFQDPMTSLNPVMKLKNHFIETILTHKDVSKEEAIEMAAKALTDVGIGADRLNDYPFQLSGGMRQRVMIALALVLHPKIVIADEPTTSLDVIVQAQILNILKGLQNEYNMGMILITHDLGVVAEVADNIGVMYGGHLVEYSTKMNIYKDAKHPYTKALLESIPNTDINDRELSFIKGYPPDLMSVPEGCRFSDRCPKVMDICKTDVPPDIFIEENRLVKCWLYNEGGAEGANNNRS
ncbi:MAG: ABC transporter ATP-binding protein [Kosmotoga sp.]|nr:MAG: ABC transporter ATP-binding protein [Kosmotoga sp.]